MERYCIFLASQSELHGEGTAGIWKSVSTHLFFWRRVELKLGILTVPLKRQQVFCGFLLNNGFSEWNLKMCLISQSTAGNMWIVFPVLRSKRNQNQPTNQTQNNAKQLTNKQKTLAAYLQIQEVWVSRLTVHIKRHRIHFKDCFQNG